MQMETKVHLMVGLVIWDSHFAIISLVPEYMIKTDILSFWQHPQIDYLPCEVRVIVVRRAKCRVSHPQHY